MPGGVVGQARNDQPCLPEALFEERHQFTAPAARVHARTAYWQPVVFARLALAELQVVGAQSPLVPLLRGIVGVPEVLPPAGDREPHVGMAQMVKPAPCRAAEIDQRVPLPDPQHEIGIHEAPVQHSLVIPARLPPETPVHEKHPHRRVKPGDSSFALARKVSSKPLNVPDNLIQRSAAACLLDRDAASAAEQHRGAVRMI